MECFALLCSGLGEVDRGLPVRFCIGALFGQTTGTIGEKQEGWGFFLGRSQARADTMAETRSGIAETTYPPTIMIFPAASGVATLRFRTRL
jgi:hypothetical protein